MGKKTIFHNKRHYIVYATVVIFYFWMASQIPYTHDDWDWGLDIGLYQLIHATVNSRYVGNFFEVIMTRSEILKTIIMGSCYFAIPYSLASIAATHHPTQKAPVRLFYFVLCNILLFTMDRRIWQQTYGWVAGFANFAVSAVFMMPWIYELYRVFDKKPTTHTAPLIHNCFLLFVTICSQLFIENLALYHTLLALTLCIISYIRTSKFCTKYFVMLAGSILGLIIMFSSNLYETLFISGSAIDEYRQIPILQDQSLPGVFLSFARASIQLLAKLYALNKSIFIAITTALILLLRNHRRQIPSKQYKVLCSANYILIFLLLGSSFLNTVLIRVQPNYSGKLFIYILFLLSALFFLTVSVEVFYLFRQDPQSKKQLFAIWFSSPLLIAPLVLTTESGARLFYTSNVFLILFFLSLLNHLVPDIRPVCGKKIIYACGAALACCILFYSIIYGNIGACKRERSEIIEIAKREDRTEIILPAYPFEGYLHFANPTNDMRLEYFKEFYSIPMNVNVIFNE